jgi:hypothetical protein
MESFQCPLHTVFMVSNIREVHVGAFTIEESMLNELSGMKICTKNTKPSTVGPLYPLQHLKSNASIQPLLARRMHLMYHNHAFPASFHVGVLRLWIRSLTVSTRETITHLEICVGIEKRTHASTTKSRHVSFKPLVEIGMQRMFRGIPNKHFALFQEYH